MFSTSHQRLCRKTRCRLPWTYTASECSCTSATWGLIIAWQPPSLGTSRKFFLASGPRCRVAALTSTRSDHSHQKFSHHIGISLFSHFVQFFPEQNLVKMCWAENPISRPRIDQVLEMLGSITHDLHGSLPVAANVRKDFLPPISHTGQLDAKTGYISPGLGPSRSAPM